jgi:hypothetical protein
VSTNDLNRLRDEETQDLLEAAGRKCTESIAALNAAAQLLRDRVAEYPGRQTIDMPMVKGVWLNSGHYLTSTPRRDLALAAWLEEEHYDGLGVCDCPDNDANCRPLALALTILETKESKR